MLNSPGGDLAAGIRLGQLFRSYSVKTEVAETYTYQAGYHEKAKRAGICASACAYAFLGGTERQLEEGSRLGFHQFRSAKAPDLGISAAVSQATGLSQAQIAMGILAAYVVEMGVDARILTIASVTSPNEIEFPSRDDLIRFRVLTLSGFGPWQMKPVKNGLIAYTERQDANASERQLNVFCVAQAPYMMLQIMRIPTWESANHRPLGFTKKDFTDAISGVVLSVDGNDQVIAGSAVISPKSGSASAGNFANVTSPNQVAEVLELSSDQTSYYAYIRLPFETVTLLEGANSIALHLDAGHWFYEFGPRADASLDEVARKEVGLALRNCI